MTTHPLIDLGDAREITHQEPGHEVFENIFELGPRPLP
jgi:hypothetical protein